MQIYRVILFVGCCSSLKVLLIGSLHSGGHRLFFDRIIHVLHHKLGHEVFMLASRDIPNENATLAMPNKNNERSIHVPVNFGTVISTMTYMENVTMPKLMKEWMKIATAFNTACMNVINDKETTDWLDSIKPDVVLTYQFEMCYNVLIEMGHIPTNTVGLNPGSYLFNEVALPQGRFMTPSYIPAAMTDRGEIMPTMMERAKNGWGWWQSYIDDYIPYNYLFSPVVSFNEILHTHPEHRHKTIITSQVLSPGVVINSDVLLDFPRPLNHDMFFLGDALFDNNKEQALPESWRTIIESGNKGVIVCSFGTTIDISSMPQKHIDTLADAFRHEELSDYTIVWKFPPTERILPSNVHVVSWIPQIALLRHPRVRLFITHTGYNSMYETLQAGTPTLNIPLSLDQVGNALRVERVTGAPMLRKATMTSMDIVNATLKSLSNNSNRSTKLAAMMSSRVAPSSKLFDNFLHNMASRRRSDWIQGDAVRTLTNVQSMSVDIAALMFASVFVLIRIVK